MTSKRYTIGVDIGGTKMTSILFNGTKAVADYTLATPKDSLDHFLIMLNALIEPLSDRAKNEKIKLSGIGMGVPGPLDSSGEKVLNPPNLPILHNVKLLEALKEKFGFESLAIDNDANCFIRAEAKLGAGKNYNNVFGLTLGTGIGGGWWINNNIYKGSHGGGVEPGHMIINSAELSDLEESYHRLTHNNPAEMAERAFRGDKLAEKIFEEFGILLGLNLANIVNLIDPEIIVLGGGVMESSELFLNIIRKTMQSHILSSESRKVKAVKSKLGNLAGAIGASLLV